MAITKTNFINYTRCPRYCALDNLRMEQLDSSISYEDYKQQELYQEKRELLGSLFEDEEFEIDVTKQLNPQMEAMMPYYKKVEFEAGKIAEKYFGNDFIYAEKTNDQQCFEADINGIKYVCYVDLFNGKDLIEVKSTTTNGYLGLKIKDESIFEKINNVLYIRKDLDPIAVEKKKAKLMDRFSSVGQYVFDIAVQRYIIEHSDNNQEFNYMLGVLNSEYVYDGSGKYHMCDNQELVTFIDVNDLTKDYQPIIDEYRKVLERNLELNNAKEYKLGTYCCRKKTNECIYFNPICGKKIPKTNSIFSYLNCYAFKDDFGDTRKCIDLVNDDYIDMLDIPSEWIKHKKHEIQRDCYQNNTVYIDKEKIKAGINSIKYPIYHLDFETFPCPLPRFKGEKPYTQSVFEFSLHIERTPGVCDFKKDSFVFLAKSFDNDEREELVKALIEHMDEPGTMFAQNYSFEKSRIKELANCFPEYKSKLLKLLDNCFDLLWLVNTNKELYTSLGFDEERASLPNYYCSKLSGSYSIKKTLPVFSDLSYADLDVRNGTEAVATYARYNQMGPEEYKLSYEALVKYCHQDTWAMVVILDALRNLVK